MLLKFKKTGTNFQQLHNTDLLTVQQRPKNALTKLNTAVLNVLICILDMYKKHLQDGDTFKADVSDWSIHYYHLCVKHLWANLHQTENCNSTRA